MTDATRPSSLAVVEIHSFTAALLALDAMEKAAAIRLVQAELNDNQGYVLKVSGSAADLHNAVAAGTAMAQRLQEPCTTAILLAPDEEGWRAAFSPPEFQPLLEQEAVITTDPSTGAHHVAAASPLAIGLIETQGFTAVIEAIDTACKAADVRVIGREKLGGGYITVIIQGDVAAVSAAVAAGRTKVEGLGKLIAAHVIARPSDAVMALLPRTSNER